MKKETKQKLAEIQAQIDIENSKSSLNRARAVTVGTCFGGTTELMVRGMNGNVLWCPMQPVEVIELIHQLAANVGCHIALKPRDDFSSWRDWRVTEAERQHLNGFPPFVNDMAPFAQLGANMPHPEQQPGRKITKESKHEQTVATQKAVNRRSTKRAAKSS